MKKIVCTFLLLFNAFFLFAQSGYKQNIAGLISITFPQKPDVADTLGVSSSHFTDSVAVYSVSSREIDQSKLILDKNKLSEFYDGTIEGILGAGQGKLISKKPFEINGLKGVEIAFITTANPNLPDLRFERLLVINNTIFVLNFWTLTENKQATQPARTAFFNSLAVTADKTTLTQGVDHPNAYLAGSIIGKLSAWAVIIGVVLGVVLLIRKITTRKKTAGKPEF